MVVTAKQMSEKTGQVIKYRMGEFTIPCTVLDVRNIYGNVQVQITPVNGEGKKWVRLWVRL